MPNKPKIVVVLGPTASGKTSLSIDLAKEYNGEVISVDSRQIYQGMDIGTAKEPRDKETIKEENKKISEEPYLIQGIPHWGVDLVKPNREMTAAEFKDYAEQKIEEITARGKLPVLAGGTGFWIQVIVDNLEIPEVEPDLTLRKHLENNFSNDELFEMYKEKDPAGAESIDRDNTRRLIRALEVCMKSGEPFSKLQSKGESKFEVLQLGIETPREKLYQRINGRVDQMVEEGLVEEVRNLIQVYGCVPVAMTGIGYRQIAEYFEALDQAKSESSFAKATEDDLLARAVEKIKKDTRNYAKRQMSWFRRDSRIKWISGIEEARKIVSQFV